MGVKMNNTTTNIVIIALTKKTLRELKKDLKVGKKKSSKSSKKKKGEKKSYKPFDIKDYMIKEKKPFIVSDSCGKGFFTNMGCETVVGKEKTCKDCDK